MKPGTQVQHPDYQPPGVVVGIDGPIAIVRFTGPDGWPFPQNVRVPVKRLRRYRPDPPLEQEFIPAPF